MLINLIVIIMPRNGISNPHISGSPPRVQTCIVFKHSHICGPSLFKPVLFKGQLYSLVTVPLCSLMDHLCLLLLPCFQCFLPHWILSISNLLSFFFKILFIFRERKGGRKRRRETSMCAYLSCTPNWGPGL